MAEDIVNNFFNFYFPCVVILKYSLYSSHLGIYFWRYKSWKQRGNQQNSSIGDTIFYFFRFYKIGTWITDLRVYYIFYEIMLALSNLGNKWRKWNLKKIRVSLKKYSGTFCVLSHFCTAGFHFDRFFSSTTKTIVFYLSPGIGKTCFHVFLACEINVGICNILLYGALTIKKREFYHCT